MNYMTSICDLSLSFDTFSRRTSGQQNMINGSRHLTNRCLWSSQGYYIAQYYNLLFISFQQYNNSIVLNLHALPEVNDDMEDSSSTRN